MRTYHACDRSAPIWLLASLAVSTPSKGLPACPGKLSADGAEKIKTFVRVAVDSERFLS